ncbi:MAG: gliding motility-associated lipoprotein GldH [Arenicella sp.]|jgi:gliding motility-associated lipoprotein GldH
MKKLILILAVVAASFACESENRIYSEHQELSPELEWLKKDKREFKVAIDDNSFNYNLSLSFRYGTGYSYETAMVKVTETSPSGIETVNEYELKVVDENGDYIGDAALDIWDSEHLIEENKTYEETGTYTYTIEQNTPVDPLVYAMEIGVILDKIP